MTMLAFQHAISIGIDEGSCLNTIGNETGKKKGPVTITKLPAAVQTMFYRRCSTYVIVVAAAAGLSRCGCRNVLSTPTGCRLLLVEIVPRGWARCLLPLMSTQIAIYRRSSKDNFN